MHVTVRAFEPGDAAAVAGVMWRSVRRAALADYTSEQTAAWLPSPPSAETMYRRATDGRTVWVAASEDGEVVGYIDLEADGHIDHLYCSPEAVGGGVAGALYDALEIAACEGGLPELHVEASEGARRLFEKKGFTVQARREWVLRGVAIHNYAMTKHLPAQRR